MKQYVFLFSGMNVPNPFILLERHDSLATKHFVIKNVNALKDMGYAKFLLEMNSELSPQQLKKQLKFILSGPGADRFPEIQALYDMLLALETHDIPYEFIDPETQAEATALTTKLQLVFESGNTAAVMAERQRKTDLRDVKMSAKIIEDSKLHSGGVLFLGGWSHKHLLQLLESNRKDYYRYAMFVDSAKDVLSDNLTHQEREVLSKISDAKYRAEFYQARVKYFDSASLLSCEMIAAECGLTTVKPIDTPVVGKFFEQATCQKYSFVVDSNMVVTATTAIDKKEELDSTVCTIKKNFPGLRFFVEGTVPDALLTIPGLNLAENERYLKEGLSKPCIKTTK